MQLRRIGGSAVVLLSVLNAGACIPSHASKPTLLVYGDSLAMWSEPATHLLFDHKYKLVFRAYMGTSICDWTGRAALDREIYRPDRVVIAFTGNTRTCSLKDYERGGVTGWLANYQRSLLALRQVFSDVPVTVVATPAMSTRRVISLNPENGNPLLNRMYAAMCRKYGMRYETGADNALSPGHRFVLKRPAFPGNGPPASIRDPDGVHLSPAGQLYFAAALGAS